MPVENVVCGYSQQDRLANPDDVEIVRNKATAWLKDLRDRRVRQVSIGPMDRLPRSLELIAGTHILNIGSGEFDSELRMAHDIIHPPDVHAGLAPLHLDHHDPPSPAGQRTRTPAQSTVHTH